jgi:hypothetical protein
MSEERKESLGYISELLIPTSHEYMGQPKYEFSRSVKISLDAENLRGSLTGTRSV